MYVWFTFRLQPDDDDLRILDDADNNLNSGSNRGADMNADADDNDKDDLDELFSELNPDDGFEF